MKWIIAVGIFLSCSVAFADDSQDNTTASSTAPVVEKADHLNKAFVFTADQYNKLIAAGEKAYRDHKTLDDLLKPVRTNPVGVIGEKGKSHESYVWFVSQGCTLFSAGAYTAASHFQSVTYPQDFAKVGGHLEHLFVRNSAL